jgi:hypothetical protein
MKNAGAPLVARREDGTRVVELLMHSAAFDKKLEQLIRESKLEKQVVEIMRDDLSNRSIDGPAAAVCARR